MQKEVRELVERDEARTGPTTFDPISRVVVGTGPGGEPFRYYGERLATYSPRDGLLRWAWAGSPTTSHAETVFREGQARGLPQLTQSIVGDLGENEAMLLARLGALVAGANGVHVVREADEIVIVGLFERTRPFDASASRYSVPPPPVTSKRPSPGPSRVAHRSLPPLPPVREIYEPRRPPRKIREPARALFLPVAESVLAALADAAPAYQQALFVLSVSIESTGRRRLVVGLVVLDEDGLLRALDPSSDLLEKAAHLVDADQRDGNGPWRKLTARILPKAGGGATLHVDVV